MKNMHQIYLNTKEQLEEERTDIEELYLAMCLNDFLCDEQLKVSEEQFNTLFGIFADYMYECNFGIDHVFAALRDNICNDCTFDPDYVIQHPEDFTGALDTALNNW